LPLPLTISIRRRLSLFACAAVLAGCATTSTNVATVGAYRDTIDLGGRLSVSYQKAGKSENERLGYAVTQWLDAGGLKYPGTVENIGFKGEVVSFKDLSIAEPDDVLFVPPL